MEIRELFADEDAVSPVIGVILMVAITVILAAVIGTFVLGLGDQVSNTAPSASFTFDFNENGNAGDCTLSTDDGSAGELDTTHDGGDSIEGTSLKLKSDGTSAVWDTDCSGSTEVTAGDSVTAGTASGETVRVVWEASSGGDTSTIGKWTGPDA